ncbi:protein FANTASTIC FOUR 4 [Gossypium raimondii]|uniref:FAF domain-containing protein n=2 Tax=Gossypium raimondii TaxID=29730 RepID=A0A0D2SSY2_GOSRA|nr:protein FANTASTIC FOUR 4 [Gossypium raimondii]KJB45171.1 hypothetical protein B456_007G293600 [Gossypium raimondii]
MTLCSSHLLLPSLIYFSLFLLALKLIMPYCYFYCYYCYSQFMLNKYYFCKKIVLSFLGLSNTNMVSPSPVSKCGLGLISANESNPDVIESSLLHLHNTKTISMPSTSPPKKKDPGGIGFIDDMGGGAGIDGLMSCTESLGFESCYERDDGAVDDRTNGYKHVKLCEDEIRDNNRWRIRKRREGRRHMKFPPPLSSLNQNGQPCFYLKPVRENGRLELTEVKIQRPEILRSVRQNGRLRLHLVSSDVCSNINQEEEEEEEENEEINQEEQEQEVLDLQEEEEEEMKVEEVWKYRVNGKGSRRCHEMVVSHLHNDYHHRQHHHMNDHHSLHVWRQPCVSIR